MANSNLKLLATLLTFSLMLASSTVKSDSLSFNYPSFTPGVRSILVDEEDTFTTGGVLQLTKKDLSGRPVPFRSGVAGFFGAVHLSDKRTGKVADFATEFTFVVNANGARPHGDGFTFFLVGIGFDFPDNSSGGFLGLFDEQTAFNTSVNQVVAVEFDSFVNEWDPQFQSDPHIGININTIRSAVTAPWPIDAQPAGAIGKASITYEAATRKLVAVVSYPNSPVQVEVSVTTAINFASVLSEWALVGFSASTGQLVETHDILSWYFTSSL